MNKSVKLAAATIAVALAVGATIVAKTGPVSRMARADTPQVPVDALTPISLAGSWVADPNHTNVVFSIQHLGISMVRGRFDDMAGTITADPDHLVKSNVHFTIQTASIDTNVKMRDDDLRSKNYFDAETYPTITFVSDNVYKGRHNTYVAEGDLTIHGVTRHINLPFTVTGPIHDQRDGIRFGVLAHIVLNRQDYNVGGHDLISNGSPAIGNDVDIDISLEAVPPKPAAS